MKHILYCRLKRLGSMMILLFIVAANIRAQVTVEATIDSLQLLIGEQAKVKLEVHFDNLPAKVVSGLNISRVVTVTMSAGNKNPYTVGFVLLSKRIYYLVFVTFGHG